MKVNINVPVITETTKEIELPIYIKSSNGTKTTNLIRIDENLYIRNYEIEHSSNVPIITIDYGECRNGLRELENIFYQIERGNSRYEIISEKEFKSILDKVLY